jgi:hypothetical protein
MTRFHTEHVAHLIPSGVGEDIVDLYDVASIDVDIFSQCRVFIYGLALDEDQQPELTDERISAWIDQLSAEFVTKAFIYPS